MNTVAQPEIIGLDVSRDWLPGGRLAFEGARRRLPGRRPPAGERALAGRVREGGGAGARLPRRPNRVVCDREGDNWELLRKADGGGAEILIRCRDHASRRSRTGEAARGSWPAPASLGSADESPAAQGRRRPWRIRVKKGSPFSIAAGSWSRLSSGWRAAGAWRRTMSGAWRARWRGRIWPHVASWCAGSKGL